MTLLATMLDQQIRHWSSGLMRTSPLAAMARDQALPARGLAVYLESLRHVFANTEKNIRRGIERARALGQTDVASFLEEKAAEENGHAAWAIADLQKLPGSAREALAPAKNLRALIALQEELLDENPICFVAYVLWSEYFTALVGDEWLGALERSGFARSQVSAVSKHVDADREHAARVLEVIDSLWTGTPDAATILAGVTKACRLFEQFCDEIYELSLHAA